MAHIHYEPVIERCLELGERALAYTLVRIKNEHRAKHLLRFIQSIAYTLASTRVLERQSMTHPGDEVLRDLLSILLRVDVPRTIAPIEYRFELAHQAFFRIPESMRLRACYPEFRKLVHDQAATLVMCDTTLFSDVLIALDFLLNEMTGPWKDGADLSTVAVITESARAAIRKADQHAGHIRIAEVMEYATLRDHDNLIMLIEQLKMRWIKTVPVDNLLLGIKAVREMPREPADV